MTNLDDLGVQRVFLNLYRYFDRSKFELLPILWKNEGKVASFLSPQEPIIETDHGLPWPRLIWRLSRYIKHLKAFRPDVVLSFVPATNVSVTLMHPFLPADTKVITCEHAFLSRAFSAGEYTGAFRQLYRLLMKKTYNDVSDALVMTAHVGKEDATEAWGIHPSKIRVIYNPQDLADLKSRALEPLDDPWFEGPVLIAAGRLTEQKGFDKLLQAFAILSKKTPAKLAILGRGHLEASLNSLAQDLGIDQSVRFLGFQQNHLRYIKNSSIFVLSSIWEAMPMVLAETMAIGTPIVAFDCPSGPYEMLESGRCGFLVKDQDVEELAATLDYALAHPEEAKRRAELAGESVQRFEVTKVVQEYQDLILLLAGKESA